LPKTIASASDDASGVRYAYKASLIGAAHRFELTHDGVAWEAGGRSGLWRYGDITAIQLSYRPVSMQARRFRTDLRHVTGRNIVILSTSWQTVALMAPQDQGYRRFIVALHARMAQAGSGARLNGGLGRGFYTASVALVMLVGLAMAGLLVRSLATGQFAGALFVVGFAALFVWQVGGFIRRNRPLAYDFNHLPQPLLP
jgi:hypothetical protein